jgi:hypothetical protein
VIYCLQSGCSLDLINATHIVLIPKKKISSRVTDFRPISLCNVIYKLISKVLANRLKKFLPQIISQTQSAFVEGRHITDNILAAFETLHTMQTKLKGKQGFMALKLDMSKAYDRVEWGFLEGVMSRLGFQDRWIHLIKGCFRSVSYSVLVNGKPYGHFIPSCGIRQGDPLSPYLFILCAEALSALLHHAERTRVITGVPIAKGRVRLNHLFFADDSLLFCKANMVEWEGLHQILERYEKASGQRLNKEKTSIFLVAIPRLLSRDQILSAAGVPATNCLEKYLGLPAMVGRSRRLAFMKSKKGYGIALVIGGTSSFLKRGRKFSLKLWPKLFLPIQ